MKKLSIVYARWIMLALVIAETISGTNFTIEKLDFSIRSSIIYLVSGLLISIFPMFQYAPSNSEMALKKNSLLKQILITFFFIYVLWYALPHIYWIFDWIKIDYHSADMIPQIMVSCKRWLTGEQVYQPMPEIWNGMLPTYLPLMWMPYSPLVFFGVDVRWTTVFFYLAGIGLLLWMLARYSKVNWLQLVIIATLIWKMVFIQTDYNRTFFAWTEEGLVVAYYLLLGYALSKKNPWLIGIAITCCLLSRYSLFFWIPSFLLFTFFVEDRRKAVIQGSVILILTTLIFIVPYFLKDPWYFLLLPQKYSTQLAGLWLNAQATNAKSLGLAKFFSINQFQLLSNIQLVLSLVAPVIFYTLLYIFRYRPTLNFAFAGLCGLKLTLTFFYNFLGAPYFYYLYMVPTLFSYIILLHFLNPESHTNKSLHPGMSLQ